MIHLPQVKKSPSDNRLYRAIRLQNGIQCLLIHDADSLKSSAALSMGVGSFKDPLSAQGIAHYLEHMLFMGTAKYPDQNDYSNFITKNGGSNNAYTSQQETNYMLEVASSAFEDALDRFAQFFISPLLKQTSAEKQLEAVHSQHQKNLLNDSWRKYQLTKHISKQGHPYNKFSTGDKNSLSSDNLQQILNNYYNENYSANLMKLVVYSQFQLQTLEKWAIQKFTPIPNKNLIRFSLSQQPFDGKAFKKLFKIVPVKDLKKLQLMWILPNKKSYYKNHPGSYISNLIGHEGKGSILSYLIQQGLATSLSSGNYDSYNCYTQFSINIDLTSKGLDRIKDIIGYILYYIQMLKEKQCPQWFFQQLKLINKLKFEFMDKRKGMSETSKIAKNMHERQIEQLIIYPYLAEQWKPQLIKQYLNQMTLDNLFVFVQAKKFETECTNQQPIYKSKFVSQQLGDLKPIQCNISLPEKNIFIPKDLSVLPLQTEKLPTLIYSSQFIDTFFKQDHVFGLPKANINLRLIFAGNYSAIEDVGRSLLLDMLKQNLRQFVYLAQMAEIDVEFSFVSYFSIDIKFKGFRDSLKSFVLQYFNRVFNFVPNDQQLFNTLIEKHRRKYANFLLSDPYRLAYDKSAATMRSNSAISDQQKLKQIQNLTLQQVNRLNKSWKQKIFAQTLFSGNITEQQTKGIAQAIQNFLISNSKPLKIQHTGQMRAACLDSNFISIVQQNLKNNNQQNSSVCVHFQVGELKIKRQLLLKLTQLVAKQPAFDYLRTQQQLGYIVFCVADDNRGVGGLSIIVQSSVKSTYNLITYIDKFVNEKMKKMVNELTQDQFKTYRNALKNLKEQKDKNLSAQTQRYWSQIVKHHYFFEKKQKQIQLIPQITLAQLKDFVNYNFFENQKRIQIHMCSAKKQVQNIQAKTQRLLNNPHIKIYHNPQQFNRKTELYPDFYAPYPRQRK